MVLVADFASAVILSVLIRIGGSFRLNLPQSSIPVTLHSLLASWGGMVLGPNIGAAGAFLHASLWIWDNCCDGGDKARDSAVGGFRDRNCSGGLTDVIRERRLGQSMPSFGYVAGMVPCAYVAGTFVDIGYARKGETYKNPSVVFHPVTAAALGQLTVLLSGVSWLILVGTHRKTNNWGPLLSHFVLPFVPGLIIKSFLAWFFLGMIRELGLYDFMRN